MRKALLIIISLFTVLSMLLVGCAPAPSQAPEATKAPEVPAATTPDRTTKAPAPTEVPTAAGPVKIKVFIHAQGDIDYSTNKFTLLLEKKFNVNFEWQVVPMDATGAKEARNLSLASGDYPDLYIMNQDLDLFTQNEMLKYGQQGVLLPLNDLIDKYAPNVKAHLEKYPYYKANAVAPDGKIYGIPQLEECYHCSFENKLWANTKWMKQLNIEMPKTTAEFKALLEAFKTKDPNGNGKEDEVPLSGTTESFGFRVVPYLMNAFIYDDDRAHLMIDNGKVDSAANKPEWKEGLLYIKSLYDAGLIDPGAFTQDGSALSKIGNNDPQILGASAAMGPWFTSLADGSKYGTDYNVIPPLTGPKGVSFATLNPIKAGGASFVLTNKASKEVQIAAMKIVDYMSTLEGFLNGRFGEKGVSWRDPLPGEVALNKDIQPLYAGIPLAKDEKPRNDGWGNTANYDWPKEVFGGWVQDTNIYISIGFERRLWQATTLYDGHQPKETYPYYAVWTDPKNVDEAALLQLNIINYIDQNSLQFITGTKDINKEWDSYVAGLDKLDLKRFLEICQHSYDASFKK